MNGKNKMIAWIAGIIGVIILLIVVIVRIEPERKASHGQRFPKPWLWRLQTGKSVRPKQNSGKNPGFRSRNRITGL